MEKSTAYKTYDKIADWFAINRSRTLFEKPYLDKVIESIQPNGIVLDMGCGTGDPMARYLINQGLTVVGVDACERMIEIANQRLPGVRFLLHDMRDLCLDEKFDAIIAWHSFFHLNQNEQRAMFPVFKQHIKPGGILLFTSGPDAGEVWSDNNGEMLYHASLSPSEYRDLFKRNYFEEVLFNVEDPECGEATVWMARYQT